MCNIFEEIDAMKQLLIILFLLLGNTAHAQEYWTYDDHSKIIIDKTISVAGSKETLFERGLQWVAAQSFSKPEKNVAFNQVISYQNKGEGKIFGNGKFKFDTKYPQLGYYDYMYMTFVYKIYVKDGQYRYVFSDFVVNRLTWHKRDHIGATSFEDYEQTRYYREHSQQSIQEHIKKLKHELKLAMTGEL